MSASPSLAPASDDALSLHALNDDVLGVVFTFLSDRDAASLASASTVTRQVFRLDHGFKARSERACARLGGDVSQLPRLRRWAGTWRAACALLNTYGGGICLGGGSSSRVIDQSLHEPSARGGGAIAEGDLGDAPSFRLIQDRTVLSPRLTFALVAGARAGDLPEALLAASGTRLYVAHSSLNWSRVTPASASFNAPLIDLADRRVLFLDECFEGVDGIHADWRPAAEALLATSARASSRNELDGIVGYSGLFDFPRSFQLEPIPATVATGPVPSSSTGLSAADFLPWTGLRVSQYGAHGTELIHLGVVRAGEVKLPSPAPTLSTGHVARTSRLSAFRKPAPNDEDVYRARWLFVGRKVTGDPNVPSGQITFKSRDTERIADPLASKPDAVAYLRSFCDSRPEPIPTDIAHAFTVSVQVNDFEGRWNPSFLEGVLFLLNSGNVFIVSQSWIMQFVDVGAWEADINARLLALARNEV